MEQRNLILAMALSMIVLLGWGVIFPDEKKVAVTEPTQSITTDIVERSVETSSDELALPPLNSDAVPVSNTQPVSDIVDDASTGQTFEISNDLMRLTVNDKGWLTQALLSDYLESLEPGAGNVAALTIAADGGHSVYVNAGVLNRSLEQPFTVAEQTERSIRLHATLDDGHVWQRQVTLVPGSYIIQIEDRIVDGAGMKVYRQVVERFPDKKLNTFYEHMGPTALFNGKLIEPDYDDLDEVGSQRMASLGGWTAIMNRYFIAALISNPEQNYPYYFKGDGRSYQAGLIDDGIVEGKDAVFTSNLYVGPKATPILEAAGSELERSVDFGWFSPISKPMHNFLGWIYDYIPNFGFCIIILVILIKTIFFYPTQKSYESMAAMRKLSPEMARIKDLYGDDRQRVSKEVMELYKKHKVNPLGGCLPIIIQIPVFFALYKVLLMSIEMRQAPFIGWITDMSVQDPFFVLPVLMGISMYIQQKLNPQPPDPIQAKVMQFLPPMFTVMFLFFPAGLVLYWVVNNCLAIVQQRWVMKRMNVD
ncbi:membrane protein insertase YidC [Mariprofundus sp. EBB-1]|uniref:membrane protein insertase YidC n=1 Tax=Mariprofundus sp. EBB-1 TaxID=2650971 RepID=UPI000EF24459|nr:membrane protein insertase YidC [Mariprofundus sp. EBB-1]RLL54704.1 membrane protein insertase YidC [Mariprofundus sp. EBB-1]